MSKRKPRRRSPQDYETLGIAALEAIECLELNNFKSVVHLRSALRNFLTLLDEQIVFLTTSKSEQSKDVKLRFPGNVEGREPTKKAEIAMKKRGIVQQPQGQTKKKH